MKKSILSFLSLLAIAILPAIANAGEAPYPARPVRLLVSAPPGGTVDLVARILAPKLTAQMGRPFVVENKPGAGGVVCAELLATAKPDGYTLGVLYSSFTTNAALRKISSYDPVKDIAPIAIAIKTPLLLAVFPGLGLKSVRDLVALAKAKPLLYSSAGNGTGAHLCGEKFKKMAGIQVTHVPYGGAAQSVTDIVTGQIQYTFTGPVVVLPWATNKGA
ncbi:MAG: tripartite tricarboxylate transporter substrate-binding protein [Pseudomonadota bacterium]